MTDAIVGSLLDVGPLKRLTRVPSHKRAAKIAPQLYSIANKPSGDGVFEARTELLRLTKEAATVRAREVYRTWWERLPPARRKTTAPAAAGRTKTVAEQFEEQTGITTLQAAQLASGRGSTARSTTRRVLQGYDDFGRPVYKTVRSRAAAGGGRAVRAGASRAGLAAARAVTVAAAGVAAYLATRAVLRHFAGSAKRAQDAGVAGALALREARAEFRAREGRAVNAQEAREMFDAYVVQLNKLGYVMNAANVPVYNRSAAQRFLTSYLSEEEQ